MDFGALHCLRCAHAIQGLKHARVTAHQQEYVTGPSAAGSDRGVMQLTVACNGLLETIGRVLDGQVKHPFSAHPKPDPDTGACMFSVIGTPACACVCSLSSELCRPRRRHRCLTCLTSVYQMCAVTGSTASSGYRQNGDPAFAGNLYFMGYNVEAPPYCWYSGLDSQGHILFDCPVPLPKGILMHDMQTTEDYAIIIDSNVEFDPQVGNLLAMLQCCSHDCRDPSLLKYLCPAREACTAAAMMKL